MNDSPFVLLPAELQTQVKGMAAERVRKLVKNDPDPWTPLCPHCHYLRQQVLSYYAKKAGKTKLTNSEIVEMLNRHITIRRRIVGRGGQVPKIDAQGRDVDYHGLFVAPNSFILNIFGPAHPMSYFINGKVTSAHGGILYLDEFFRNDEALRDAFLEVQENKVVSRGGSPAVKLDVVIVGGSNTESIKKVKAAGGRAGVDRVREVDMMGSVNPHFIGATMLLMKGEDRLLTQSLEGSFASLTSQQEAEGEEAKPWQAPAILPGNLDALFPLPLSDQPYTGPDHRYKVWIRSEDKKVHISPHALSYIAMVVSASRFNTDPAAASELGEYKVIGSAVFRDVVTRLKVLTRELTITPAESTELEALSKLLKEGDSGISTRDAANIWLTEAIAEAQKEGNGDCVTPLLAKRVLKRLLHTGAVQFTDNQTRLKWERLADIVAHHFTVPALQDDVNAAFGHDSGSAEGIYDEIYKELDVLQHDPTAKEYKSPQDDTARPIDLPRLAEIEQIYLTTQRRPLARGEIIQYHSRPAGTRVEIHRHEGLMNAIRRYLAHAAEKLIPFDAMLRFANTGEGSVEERSRFSHAQQILIHGLGYCPRCIKDAMHLKHESQVSGKKPN